METVYNIDNQVAKIAKEHKIITDYVVKFNSSLKNRDKEFFKGIAGFFDFLANDLRGHFLFEEMVIFPAAIAGKPAYENILMVMSLQKDHGVLEENLNALIVQLNDLKINRQKLTTELINQIKAFFDALKAHARSEMTDLFPIVDATPESKALMEKYAAEMNRGE